MFNPLNWLERLPRYGRFILLLRQRRRELLTGLSLLADELDFNAEAVERYHEGNRSMSSLRNDIKLDTWNREQDRAWLINRADSALWADLKSTYADLERTTRRGATPPATDTLTSLAERARAASY